MIICFNTANLISSPQNRVLSEFSYFKLIIKI
jgi:hypothetical protein